VPGEDDGGGRIVPNCLFPRSLGAAERTAGRDGEGQRKGGGSSRYEDSMTKYYKIIDMVQD
jgi:hypothetical protein